MRPQTNHDSPQKETLARKWLGYTFWLGIFLILSLGLGYFRGSDHGTVPSLEGIQLLHPEEHSATRDWLQSQTFSDRQENPNFSHNVGNPDATDNTNIPGNPSNPLNLKRKPSVYYFWATWCGACKLNDPFLKTALKGLSDQGVHFLSLEEGRGSEEALTEFLVAKQIGYPVAIANRNTLEQFRVEAFPTTVFADAQGKVRFVDTGIMNPLSFWIRVYLLRLF